MDTEAITEVLQAHPLFERLNAETLSEVASFTRYRQLPGKSRLFTQGEPCSHMYLLISGLARVFQLNPKGKEHTLHLVLPGQTFAEIAAMDGRSYPASADVLRKTELLAIDAQAIADLLDRSHVACRQLLLGMATWMRRTVALMEDMVLRDARGRLANWLLREADRANGGLRIPGSQAQLATHLNLAPETLSRTLKIFEAAGLLTHAGQTLTVRDRDGLEAIRDGMD